MTKVICCSVLKNEISFLIKKRNLNMTLCSIDSILHMKPSKLQKTLEDKASKQSKKTILVYGDCAPSMHKLSGLPHIHKIDAVNCAEMLLGSERYRILRKKGIFFILPEWLERWEEIFFHATGFSRLTEARLFIQDMHSGFLYLDTGLSPIPCKQLHKMENDYEIPVHIMPVSLAILYKKLLEADRWL